MTAFQEKYGMAKAITPLAAVLLLAATVPLAAKPRVSGSTLPGFVELAPVLELVLMHLDVELRDSLLQPLLNLRHGQVVHNRPNLL